MRTGIVLVALISAGITLRSAQRGLTSDSGAAVRQGHELFTRVWAVSEGLGPLINARSCVGCHASPRTGGSGADERSLVSVVQTAPNSSRGRVFRRLRISTTGAIDEHAIPVSSVLRKAPSLLGSGVLESISADEIIAGARELGTRGRIPSGKFGWKGQLRDLDEATAAAFANELGLTNSAFPEGSTTIDVSQAQIDAVAAFIRSLSPLASGKTQDGALGHRLFQRLSCATCHRPSFPSLEQHRVFPYTDLLLHDMGAALADGISEGSATGSEFRTPPLWGLAKTGPPYLHDGRAKTLHDAITAHGGEAEQSAIEYQKLSSDERTALLLFLRSL